MPKTAISECVKALRALDEALAQEQQPKPEGWFTVEDVSREAGCSLSTARDRVRDMVRLEIVERQIWQNGAARVPIYRKR